MFKDRWYAVPGKCVLRDAKTRTETPTAGHLCTETVTQGVGGQATCATRHVEAYVKASRRGWGGQQNRDFGVTYLTDAP